MKIEPTGKPHAPPEASDKTSRAIHKQAQELEGVFLRKLIEESKVGQATSSSGYGSMAVDALSSAIGNAGGLGLAKMIEQALKQRKA